MQDQRIPVILVAILVLMALFVVAAVLYNHVNPQASSSAVYGRMAYTCLIR